MRVLRSRFIPATFLLYAAACSKATSEGTGAAVPPAPAAENQAAASAKPKGYPYTQADVEFMTGMIGHHAQAMVMAGWAPSHGASPSIQTLAAGSSTRSRTRSPPCSVAPGPGPAGAGAEPSR